MKPKIKLLIALSLLLTALITVACADQSRAARTPSSSSVISPTPEGAFKVSTLAVNPAEINAGIQAIITANVANTGETDEKYLGKVRIDNLTRQGLPAYLFSEEVIIPAGSTRLLSVFTSINTAGKYKVTWGETTGELVVNPEETPDPTSTKNPKTSLVDIIAPEIKSVDVVTGKPVSLKQYSGSAVLLNFVNYGCSSILNNKVSIQLLEIKQVKEQRGDFMPISVFCGCCPPEVLRDFAKQNNFDWPWILDTDNSLAAKYGNYLKKYSYPTLVFVDEKQIIREFTGAINASTINQKLDNLLSASQ